MSSDAEVEKWDTRAAVIDRLSELVRRASTYRLLVHETVADRLRLSLSDVRCLDVVRNEPDVTPGRVAEATGLSTSAASAAIDRLERRGFVMRSRDDYDRRRVFIESTGQHEANTARLFEPLVSAATAILEDYTDEELALLTDFLEQLSSASAELIMREKDRPRPGTGPAGSGQS